jgi:hypothetical protein
MRHAAFERLALLVNDGRFLLRRADVVGQAQSSDESALALHEVIAEIAHEADAEHRRRDVAGALLQLVDDDHRQTIAAILLTSNVKNA